MDFEKTHSAYKINTIYGRYLNLQMIEPILQKWNSKNQLEILGNSVQGKPIYRFNLGHGKTKILMWSQMHGNESTTTKALIDLMHFLQSDSDHASAILEKYSFCIIPILNPDGAEVYTRVNANKVDLNRDFQNLTQPESQLLMKCYQEFKPDFCYNLHDQRTIFGVGTSGKPATISFLAPSFNVERDYNDTRRASVSKIMEMVHVLKEMIPGQIGRFDDAFNLNCVGDAFQFLKTPTVLIEAGHFPKDYEREETRKYVFIAILSALNVNNENVIVDRELTDYLNIPQNNPNYFDFIYKNVVVNYENSNLITNFALQFEERVLNNKIVFNAFIAKVGNLDGYFGHETYDASEALYTDKIDNIPRENEIADFSLDKNVKFVNGLLKKY